MEARAEQVGLINQYLSGRSKLINPEFAMGNPLTRVQGKFEE